MLIFFIRHELRRGVSIHNANPEAKLKLTYRLAMAFSLTLILGLIVFGGGRSEAYYRAGAAGCGPRGCAAVGVAGTGRYGYGYRAGGVVVLRY